MQAVYARCAGLDVHKNTVVACRIWQEANGDKHQETKSFGTTTSELLELSDWLSEWECTHAAMESTGVYWKPIYNILESSFQVLLVNAQHIKHVPGRKTDVKDAEWIAELLQYGLLKASFIPPAPQRDLRDLTRYRTKLVQERAREVNRVQKVLEDANIKLSSVVTDTLGVSGRAMLDALIDGCADPKAMAQLAKKRMRSKIPQLEKALAGIVRDHHRFLLASHLEHIDSLDMHIASISMEIDHRISGAGQTQDDNPKEPSIGDMSIPLSFDQAVNLLDTIPGVNRNISETIVSELGTDMSRFPTAAHAASWAGLAPGNNQSGGKQRSGRTRKGNQALRNALVEAALAASHTKGTYLSSQYHRLAGLKGRKRANVAVAHSILVIAYHMLKYHQPYQDLGANYFDEHKKEALIHRLTKRISKLGYNVTLEPIAARTS